VEEQVREIRADLPAGYYRQLPKLAEGPLAGFPRIFGLAWAFVAHTDSRSDPEMLRRFVRAYQRVQPLTIGELWAVPITLRIVLVENLRRSARRIVVGRAAREEADALADRLLGAGAHSEPVRAVLQRYEQAPLSGAFAVQLVQRLRDQDPKVARVLNWLEERLAAQGTTTEQIVHDDHQRQAATNVTVRNIITSMRLISDLDWAELFESVSLVDDILRRGSNFAEMDFPTRNLYRTAIEELARGSALTELDIARAALRVREETGGPDGQCALVSDDRERDPGYHLIAGGRPAFEKAIGFRAPLSSWPRRFNAALGIGGYIVIVLVAAAVLLCLPLLALEPVISPAWLILFALLGLIPALDAAVPLVNRAVTREIRARILPGLELSDGVPPHLRTLVAVPTLLTSQAGIEEQIERLEIHHLASQEGDLYFALLSDWTDAATEHAEGDSALLDAAVAGIARLNRLYGPGKGGARFHLLHRRRVWNEGQQQWLGWERKRGKLHELNRLLRGATDTTFMNVGGVQPAPPSGVRYVITLDADTRMPRETPRRLVGKMAHPLNHPRFDPTARRVVEGHGLLQPRVSPALPIGREGSLFQRILSSPSGIDPYGSAVSDVYQDLCGEGTYTGKGIYDVDAFEAALAGRVPECTMLSHDLFEGIFARAGLVSDIELVEEFPSRYDVAAARHHRWVRGDWQLLPWLLGRGYAPRGGPGTNARLNGTSAIPNGTSATLNGTGATPNSTGAIPNGTSAAVMLNGADPTLKKANAIPLIGRWKMLDNLRRSLSAPASLAALLAGWTLPLHEALIWTAYVLITLSVPPLIPVVGAMVPRRGGGTVRSQLRTFGAELAHAAGQIVLFAIFLAHQACLMVDAIGRTLVRLLVTRKHLLDWVTAAQAKVNSRLDLAGFYRQMASSVVIATAAALIVWFVGAEAWPVAVPFIAAWVAAPAVARWTSLSPFTAGHLPVSDADARALRLVARRTWRFFETFVTEADHMLPPDNFQEDPRPIVAHRTSPTNIGLYLLSAVGARDFGWAGTVETVERLETTLATMGSLQRFRGHFLNWYDTGNLRPLEPQYISSVDSGNLAGHLIALANACGDWIRRPLAGSEAFAGIEDALHLTRETLDALPADRRTQTITRDQLDDALDALAAALRPDAVPPEDVAARLPQLASLAATMVDIARTLASERDDEPGAEMRYWAEAAQRGVESHLRDYAQSDVAVRALEERLAAIAATARAMAAAMEFGFLLDPERKLLAIGYRVSDGQRDPSCYDLLASEARLASFIAIAKCDVPSRHWFRLGRAVTPVGLGAALVSWSGSMFEYLMPSLVMRAPAGSLLEQTNGLVVRRQIDYGRNLGVPWGISESAYHVRDLELTYQYSNFGVPGLGLKRGLSENVVVAPYATALAAMIEPAAAARNFTTLALLGARGRYGYYEALDYTRSRLPEGTDFAIVRAFMAHHQGMSVVAIANALLDGEMRARFHAEPIVQATELLLHERTPRDVAVAHPRAEEVQTAARVRGLELPAMRRLYSANHATPEAHLLSNGRYSVMLTAAGSGYSRWGDLGITRWREDATRDDWGTYFFVRDVQSGDVWSAGYQPSAVEPDSYEVTFSEDRAEFVRHDGSVTTMLDVVVSPEDNAEVRRVSLMNRGNRARDIELTSYAELVLAPPAADAAHPAFSKLFVQTEYLPRHGTILATRRRRSPTEPEIWAAHFAVIEGEATGEPEIETDRARFLGRGREVRTPMAVIDGLPLSNTWGTVLDPVFALRYRFRIPPRRTVRVAYWTVAASTRDEVLDLADKHRDVTAFDRAVTLAWTQAQVQLSHLGIDAEEASVFQRLAGRVLHADPTMRPSSDVLRRGAGAPPALWAHGISGDIPIVLVRIDNIEDIAIVRQLLRAQEYWRMKQLAVDLVILNERASSYVQDLQIALEALVRTSQARPQIAGSAERRSVFVLRADLISAETRGVLLSMARAVLTARRGTLFEQIGRLEDQEVAPPPRRRQVTPAGTAQPEAIPADVEFFNGLGGFDEDGREYVTILPAGRWIPAPWINVIANPSFGFQVAVEGSGYTWALSSRENQLTPWANDPVTDRPGEVIYVRDEDTGELWGPTALPIRDETAPYIVRHGQGYSSFEHTAHGVALDLVQYVPLDDPIKISQLTIRNLSGRGRRLSVTAYVEWVLGPSRSASALSLVTEIDPESGAMLARNPWNVVFGSRVAFADLAGRQTAWTGDRREFLGRNGTLDNPAALATGAPLSKRVGAGLDACGALQTTLELAPGATAEVIFFLGEAASTTEAQSLIARYRAADLEAVLSAVVRFWDDVLGTVQVKTPDRSMDLLLNRWALYQTLACRVWARAAVYQASGAYGFRDQLQDGMALALARPALTREHLLRAAARQFVEGDVQHWWLPPTGQGVRTRISDDKVWLGWCVAHYVETTGDVAVLDEPVAFLEGHPLRPDEHDAYFQPAVADERATLFEHCARALDASLALGKHGLPLIGTGDWNDGMNRVGEAGKGESVWLGWFLHAALGAFAPVAKARGESARAARWSAHAAALKNALEQDGWDGQWYRRAYFDDGTALGSAMNDECRIDSIAQSWSVISGAADPARARRAMASADEKLVRRPDGLALLFTPPFNRTSLDPGYVKGYPPGIRENGGQYTHAAAWLAIAFAALGDGDKAAEVFSILNPVNRANTRAGVQRYKVEPYVVAADVYSVAPHTGRGGWTWYTGSAGWLYRAGIEAILGLRLQGAFIRLDPCIPKSWPRFEIVFKHRSARYEIAVENPAGVSRGVRSVALDGQTLPDGAERVPLVDDGRTHEVRVILG
jgi:cyclic beta-1,2-glucan synthetase